MFDGWMPLWAGTTFSARNMDVNKTSRVLLRTVAALKKTNNCYSMGGWISQLTPRSTPALSKRAFLGFPYPSIPEFNPSSLAIPLRSPVYPFVQPVLLIQVFLSSVFSAHFSSTRHSFSKQSYLHQCFKPTSSTWKSPNLCFKCSFWLCSILKKQNHLEFRSFYSNFPLTPQFQTLKHQNDRVKYRVNMHWQ